jgi:hypothetical protein
MTPDDHATKARELWKAWCYSEGKTSEQQFIDTVAPALRAAAEAEREACAKVADSFADSPRTIGCALVANDIRARGGAR